MRYPTLPTTALIALFLGLSVSAIHSASASKSDVARSLASRFFPAEDVRETRTDMRIIELHIQSTLVDRGTAATRLKDRLKDHRIRRRGDTVADGPDDGYLPGAEEFDPYWEDVTSVEDTLGSRINVDVQQGKEAIQVRLGSPSTDL